VVPNSHKSLNLVVPRCLIRGYTDFLPMSCLNTSRFLGLFLLLTFGLTAQQKTLAPGEFVDWLPITDAERQSNAPAVDKNAGAEVLLWRVYLADEVISNVTIQRVMYHYVRLKVFDAKGKEQVSTIDLRAANNGNIIDVSGRTVKADGTAV